MSERWRLAGAAAALAASFLIWPAATAIATGRIDAYRETQVAWAMVAGNSGYPWLAALVGKGNLAQTVVSLLVLGGVVAVVTRPGARAWPLVLRVWPIAYLLFILAATPPTASIFRFLLLAVVPWWPVPELSRGIRATAARGALIAMVVALGAVVQFLWLRAYFVIDPASLGNP